jgi:hypothetical protein
MTDHDERLRERLGSLGQSEPVPSFDDCWRRAQARSRAERGAEASPWRWVLGPAVAVGAAGCALLLVIALGPATGPGGGTQQVAVADAGPADSPLAGPLLADTLLAGLETPDLPTSSIAAADTEQEEARPGYGLYEAGTDFLLTLEIPAWEQAGERNVL